MTDTVFFFFNDTAPTEIYPLSLHDALPILQTAGPFGAASADLKLTERRARRVLRPLLARGVVPIVPVFLGAAPDGQVATLGRGWSELTATLPARGLGPPEVSPSKDLPGRLIADPRMVPVT